MPRYIDYQGKRLPQGSGPTNLKNYVEGKHYKHGETPRIPKEDFYEEVRYANTSDIRYVHLKNKAIRAQGIVSGTDGLPSRPEIQGSRSSSSSQATPSDISFKLVPTDINDPRLQRVSNNTTCLELLVTGTKSAIRGWDARMRTGSMSYDPEKDEYFVEVKLKGGPYDGYTNYSVVPMKYHVTGSYFVRLSKETFEISSRRKKSVENALYYLQSTAAMISDGRGWQVIFN